MNALIFRTEAGMQRKFRILTDLFSDGQHHFWLAALLTVGMLAGCDPSQFVGSEKTNQNVANTEVDFATERVMIGAFNIETFGRAKMSNASVMKILVDIARKFDVLAIQELRSTDQSIVPKFVEMINSTGRKFEYIVGPRQGYTISKEQYVYIYDSERIATIGEAYVAVDPSEIIHRSPVVARFVFQPASFDDSDTRFPLLNSSQRPGFSFTLLNIHVDPDEVRTELPALTNVVRGVMANHPDEDDFLIVGDLNAPPQYYEPLHWFDNQQTVVTGDIPTKPRQKRSIDNIVFNSQLTSEFSGNAGVFNVQQEYGLTLEEALQVSDHYPVWATFSATEAPHGATVKEPGILR